MKKEQVNIIKCELIYLLQYNKQLFEKTKDFDIIKNIDKLKEIISKIEKVDKASCIK